jgi:tetratricopeptide (TPR) repeat protein
VRGREFPGWVEPIEELKRQERHSEALELLMECIEAAEMDEQRIFPAPWYSWQAAVIFRKQREYQKEVEVLERWVNALPAIYDLSKWGASARRMFPRLERAREIARRMGAES